VKTLKADRQSVFQTLIAAVVLSRLDYGNATLAGLPANLLNRLQSVLNASARSIAGLRRSAHITDTLASFHLLCSDVNKATSHKASAKARELKAKAKDFQHSPRPGQGQGHTRHTATVLDQNNTSDVIYLLQTIAGNDKNKILFITSASIFTGSIARSANLPVFNLLRGRF